MTHGSHRQAASAASTGRAKVTGQAKYAAEYQRARTSPTASSSPAPIARGRITRIDTRGGAGAARRAAGLHAREPADARRGSTAATSDEVAPPGSPFRPLYDDEIRLQRPAGRAGRGRDLRAGALRRVARAGRIRGRAARDRPARQRAARPTSPKTSERHRAAAEARAAMPTRRFAQRRRCGSTPSTACRSSTTTRWRCSRRPWSGTRTARSPSTTRRRACRTSSDYLCKRVRPRQGRRARASRPFVGGAFGSGLRPQYQVFLAVLAARELKRSVRVALTRQQMFTLRPPAGDAASASRSGAAPTARCRRSSTRRSPRPRGSRTTARTSSTGRACSTTATTSSSTTSSRRSTCTRRATCARRAPPGACTRSRCAMDELAVRARHRSARAAAEELRRDATRTTASRSRARSCAACYRAGRASGSAGRSATPSRARCATAAS